MPDDPRKTTSEISEQFLLGDLLKLLMGEIEQVGVRRGFGTGSAPSVYTRVPGAVFPGVTPWGQRDTRRRPAPVLAPQVVYVAPQPVTAAPTLAGTVAQTMRGKD